MVRRREAMRGRSEPTSLGEALRIFQRQLDLEDQDRFSVTAKLISDVLGVMLSQSCELTQLSRTKAKITCNSPQALAAARLRSAAIEASLRQAEIEQRIEFQLRR